MRQLLKMDDDETLSSSGSSNASFTWAPRTGQGSSSWSTNKSIAMDFAKQNTDDTKSYALIMTAMKNDNPNAMLDCSSGLYDIPELGNYNAESEVICLGEIKVAKITWQSF